MRRDVFQALADPLRRDIICMVAKKSMTPNEVSQSFEVSRQAVSKHMRILCECGILELEIRGREYYYSVQGKKLEEVDRWLESFREIWEDKFSQLDGVLQHLKPNKHGKSKQNPDR